MATTLLSKIQHATAKEAIAQEDVDWVVGSKNRQVKRHEVIVAPRPLTRIETFETTRDGLQAIHYIIGKTNLAQCKYSVFEWSQGFNDVTGKLVSLTHGAGLFHLDSAVSKLSFVKSKKFLPGDKKLHGFVFGFSADGILCQLAAVIRPSEPSWLYCAIIINLTLMLASFALWIFAASKIAEANQKKKTIPPPNTQQQR